MSVKKTIKITLGVLAFFILPSLLFFGFLYFKYNEDLPNGIEGPKADALANNMLVALNYEAYNNTNYLEWTHRNRRHYKWQKKDSTCLVYWEEYKIDLNLKDNALSKAYVHNFKVDDEKADELINEATEYFNNDSFWLVAPYTVFNEGVQRKLVDINNEKTLLVTYPSNDSYIWLLDDSGKPRSFKMWTSLLPIDGLEASWTNWITTESGAQLPTSHNLLFFSFNIRDVIGKE